MRNPEQILLKVPDAAHVLGVGRSTVYELAAAGELTMVHIGRAVRVPMRALTEYAEKLEREAADA